MNCGTEDGARPGQVAAEHAAGLDQTALLSTLSASIPQLRRYLSARASRSIDVDDIVQDTLVRALARLDSLEFETPHAVLGYLQRVAWNLVLDAYRRSARRPALAALDENMAGPHDNPLERLMKRERRRHAARRLVRLQPGVRKALLMRVRGERALNRLADVMGRSSPGAARIALYRAVRGLK